MIENGGELGLEIAEPDLQRRRALSLPGRLGGEPRRAGATFGLGGGNALLPSGSYTSGATYTVTNAIHIAAGAYGEFNQPSTSNNVRFVDLLQNVVFDGNGGQFNLNCSGNGTNDNIVQANIQAAGPGTNNIVQIGQGNGNRATDNYQLLNFTGSGTVTVTQADTFTPPTFNGQVNAGVTVKYGQTSTSNYQILSAPWATTSK